MELRDDEINGGEAVVAIVCISPCLFFSSFDPNPIGEFFFSFSSFFIILMDIVFTFSLIKPTTSKMVDTWPRLIKAQD